MRPVSWSFLLGSHNAEIGFGAAMEVLTCGGSAMDAVEIGIRRVEANPEDHSVGYGGYPNLLGEIELDAAVMNGSDRTSGAVAALKGYAYPISVARKVMDFLPHVLLAGEGAARFAREMGCETRDLRTDEAYAVWEKRLREDMSDEEFEALDDRTDLRRWVEMASDPERTHGTVNLIARDREGHLAVGISTSGWSWKYPGRVGDSPIIGAGLYADDRYGAAACTGTGEMAIRAATAHTVVGGIRHGLSLREAAREAMTDLNELGGRYISGMNLIAVDAAGNHVGLSSYEDRTYLYFDESMQSPQEQARVQVSVEPRWQRRYR
jgi:L-asparaginase / beta-aspartyl-peptidase